MSESQSAYSLVEQCLETMHQGGTLKRIFSLTFLYFVLAAIGISNAQEPLPKIHALRNFDGILDGRIQIWSLDEQTGILTPIVNIRHEEGKIATHFIVDVEQSDLLFIVFDNEYPYLGESRLIRYDWETNTEQIIYERRNLVAILNHPQDNRLVVSYYPEDTQSVLSNTVIYSCLLDIETQACYEFDNPLPLIPYDWIWLDDFQALRVSHWLEIPGIIELVNLETGEVLSTVTITNEYLEFWHPMPNSSDIFLLGGVKERNAHAELEYHFHRLNLETFETTFLASISAPEPIRYPILSPDGKHLLYLYSGRSNDLDSSGFVQIVDVETGTQVTNLSLSIFGPSGDILELDEFQWAYDSASVLGIATADEDQPNYIVRLDVHSGEIVFLTTIEEDIGFANPRYSQYK